MTFSQPAQEPRRAHTISDGLAAISTADRTLAIVAMDQRGTLRRMYQAIGVDEPTTDQMIELKFNIISSLRGSASAFLIDPDYGVPAAKKSLENGADFGVLISAEPAIRGTINGEPRTHRDPQQSAVWVANMGGDAVKFLVQLRADRTANPTGPDTRAEVLHVIKEVIDDCREFGIPSIIENLIFPLSGEAPWSPQQRADHIIEAAALIDELGPDVIKLEYPGDGASCRRLANTIKRPWAVLSAGVGFNEFEEVVKISCDEGGASGFIAGRSIWKEAVGMESNAGKRFLAETGRQRLDALRRAIDGRATPLPAA